MSAVRTERLLNLLTLLLNARRPISLREIREMDEFQAYCTEDPKSGERAFERDKATLLELGVPLRWVAPEQHEDDDSGYGGYIIDRDRYYMPDPELSPAELALLSIAGAAAATIEGFPWRGAVIRALAKLGFDVDEEGRAPALAHAPLEPGLDAERVGRALQAIHDCLRARRRLQFGYGGKNGDVTVRQVDPYGLYYRDRAWYLVGFCHLRRAERTFHLGRMTDVAEAPGQKRAGFDVPDSFDLGAHVRRRPWEFPVHAPCEVVIRLAERLVAAIPEIFGGNAQVERTDQGAFVRLQVTHTDALIEAVLPYGAAAEVTSPREVRQRLRAIYDELARRYAGGKGGTRAEEGAA